MKITSIWAISFLYLMQVNVNLRADDKTAVSWHFTHTQDAFAVFIDDRETTARTTGLSNLGFTVARPSQAVLLFVDGLWLNRDDPFPPLLGDFNGVSNIAGEKTVRLYHAVLNFGKIDSRWSSSIGQQVIDDNFLIVDEAAQLINSGFGMASVITGNTHIPSYPLSSLGVHVRYQNVSSGFYSAFGIYDGNSGNQISNAHGANIDLNSKDGVVVIGELAWKLHDDVRNQSRIKIGAWHHTGEFLERISGEKRRRNSAFYAIVEGRLSLSNRQFGYFARVARMRVQARSQLTRGIEIGINWYGPLASRPDEKLSIGFIWSHFGDASIDFQEQNQTPFVQQNEGVLELNYKFKINHWLSLQPDIQWLVNPHNADKNAFVAGIRTSIDF